MEQVGWRIHSRGVEMRGRMNRKEMKPLFSVMLRKCLSVLFFLATAGRLGPREGRKVQKIGNGQRKYQSGRKMDKDRTHTIVRRKKQRVQKSNPWLGFIVQCPDRYIIPPDQHIPEEAKDKRRFVSRQSSKSYPVATNTLSDFRLVGGEGCLGR
jgi:hypothetical protein